VFNSNAEPNADNIQKVEPKKKRTAPKKRVARSRVTKSRVKKNTMQTSKQPCPELGTGDQTPAKRIRTSKPTEVVNPNLEEPIEDEMSFFNEFIDPAAYLSTWTNPVANEIPHRQVNGPVIFDDYLTSDVGQNDTDWFASTSCQLGALSEWNYASTTLPDRGSIVKQVEEEFDEIDDDEIADLEASFSDIPDQATSSPTASTQAPNYIHIESQIRTKSLQNEQTIHNPMVSISPVRPKSIQFSTQRLYSSQAITQVSPDAKVETCFRIGEAINAGVRALREDTDILIELYARVQSSVRAKGSPQQRFKLIDLQHARPPYLVAFYELWQSDPKGDCESRVFLPYVHEKKLCRCLGRMRRDSDKKLILVILNIWAIDMDNVNYNKRLHRRK
jgi:hypothetical protein